MATKSKNTNPIVKILCIFLSVLLAFGAAFLASDAITVADLFQEPAVLLSENPEKDGYKESDIIAVTSYLAQNVDTLREYYMDTMTDEARVFLKDYRDDFINKGLQKFINEPEEEPSFYYVITYGDYQIELRTWEMEENFAMDHIQYDYTNKQVKEHLGALYDRYLKGDRLLSNYSDFDLNSVDYDFYYVMKDLRTGKEYKRLPDGMSKKDIKSQKYYYTYTKNGGSEYSDALATFNMDNYINPKDELEISYFVKDNEGHFSNMVGLYNKAKNQNIRKEFVSAIVLALLAILLALFSFVFAGNRDENGKLKLLFLDYIPNELHIALSGGAGFGLFLLYIMVMEELTPYQYDVANAKLITMLAGLCCAGIWLLFIELVTSIVRLSKSEKHYWKNLLVVWLGYGLFKLGKLLHTRSKKNRRKLKELLGYKPVNFKKRIILFLTGYGVVNLFLFIMECIWISQGRYNEGQFLAVVTAILIVALNIVSVVFVTRYVVSLDKIITSAHNRTPITLNYDKLPNSLKTLVNSIRYSNQELQTAVNKAVKDEKMRTELITNVSHDLKTPLTSIITYVDLLKQCDIDDANAQEYIAVLDEKGIKLKRLIDDLIEASKVTSGVITLNPTTLDLSELATQAVVEHQREFEENNLELVYKGDQRNVLAFSDGNKTYRVIENLLSNARKYSAKGTRVYADVFSANNTAIFEIKNISSQPLDITPEELIERFVRGDKSRNAEGNGLGLSIADNLCRAMHGRLELSIDGDLFKARVILPIK